MSQHIHCAPIKWQEKGQTCVCCVWFGQEGPIIQLNIWWFTGQQQNSPNVRKRGTVMLLFCTRGPKERTWLPTISYPSSLSPSLWRQHFTVNLAVIASKMGFMVSDPAVNKAWNGGDTSIKLWTWTLFPQEWAYSRPLVLLCILILNQVGVTA